MLNSKKLDKTMASEKVGIRFYTRIEKNGKSMLKPLTFTTEISLKLVRAILDNTIIPEFYDTLAKNLKDRGVKEGSTVQVRAEFKEVHTMLHPELKGTKVLCEVNV